MTPRRYISGDEDSARWDALDLRRGDIVVSTRSKHGTTWAQTILLLLVHGRVQPPAPLSVVSPWLDHLVEPIDDVVARLDAQRHRRVIKTHTPLDGLPWEEGVTYVVVARHPLDAAVSLYHQGANIDRDRLRALTTNPASAAAERPDLTTWLTRWIQADAAPTEALDSLPGVLWHLSDAWRRHSSDAWRRAPQSNVILIHYTDLLADLEGQMRMLAEALDIPLPADFDQLVQAATFDQMRARADVLAPDAGQILRDRRAFFRAGRSGAGAAALDEAHLGAYHARAAALASGDLLRWLHR